MHDAGDARTEGVAQLVQRKLDGRGGCKVRLQDLERGVLRFAVESDDTVAVAQRLGQRLAEVASGASDQNQRAQVGVGHVVGLLSMSAGCGL